MSVLFAASFIVRQGCDVHAWRILIGINTNRLVANTQEGGLPRRRPSGETQVKLGRHGVPEYPNAAHMLNED